VSLRIEGRLVTRSPRRSRFVLFAALASMMTFAALASETRALVCVFGVAISFAVACFSALTQPRASPPYEGAIEALDRQVVIGSHRIERSAIVSAHREQDVAHIELRDGTLHQLRASSAEVEALVEALGFGAGKSVLRYVVGGYASVATQRLATLATVAMVTLASPLVAGLLFSIVLAVFAHRQDEITSALVLALPAIVATSMAVKLFRATRRVPVYVGAEAVRVHGRIFPLSQARVRTSDRRIAIASALDEVVIDCASSREASTLERAIEDARHGRSRTVVDTTPLARAGDDVDAWKSRLIALLDVGAYRATIHADELAQVAEDPSSPAELRVAAALALSTLSEHAPQRTRVRSAIEAVASPKLRLALERAETGELDAEAIEELARERQ
jgi:hypothetical protein